MSRNFLADDRCVDIHSLAGCSAAAILNRSQGFESLQAVRQWMMTFEQAYNEIHLHSGINFVTLASRHRYEDCEILKHREQVFEAAKANHPRRWSGDTRDWRRKIVGHPSKLQTVTMDVYTVAFGET